jgi:hypothetical protein
MPITMIVLLMASVTVWDPPPRSSIIPNIPLHNKTLYQVEGLEPLATTYVCLDAEALAKAHLDHHPTNLSLPYPHLMPPPPHTHTPKHTGYTQQVEGVEPLATTDVCLDADSEASG